MALLRADEIIEIAVRLEDQGEAFYTLASQTAADSELQQLFGDLATQERLHRRAFRRLEETGVRFILTPAQWQEFQGYVSALVEHSFFREPDGGLQRAAEAGDARTALRAALDFEKDTILFYHELRGMVPEKEHEIVDQVIAEERHHVQRLGEHLARMG